ncbi:MAG: mechanosensitive ion channel family protein [Candidatus Methanomethylophilaceae archaeon]|nr:potassium-dependent mechanosensitive channel [Candidatus Methanomethylophilaceae archaeon]
MRFKPPLAVVVLLSVLAIVAVPLADVEEAYAATVADINYEITYSTGNGTFQEYVKDVSPDIGVNSGSELKINVMINSQAAGERTIYFNQSEFNDRISSVVVTDADGPVVLSAGQIYSFEVIVTPNTNTHGTGEVKLNMVVGDPVAGTNETVPIDIAINVLSAVSSEGYYNKIMGIYNNPFGEPFDQPAYAAILTLAIWVIMGIAAAYAVIPAILWAPLRNNNQTRREITRGIGKMVVMFATVAGIGQTIRVYGASDYYIQIFDTMSLVLYILLGATIAWKLYLVIIDNVFRKIGTNTSVGGVDETLIPLFRMIGRITIGVVAVAAIFSALGADLMGIIAGAGIAGLALSLGAQSTLNQFFSGLSLLLTRPFREGDIVRIGSEGTVLKVDSVGVMNTKFHHTDNEQVITMPNNMVSSAVIYNYTAENSFYHFYIYFGVAYGSDIDKAKSIMMEAALDNPNVMKGGSVPMPGVRMTALADSSVTLRLSVYAYDYGDSFSTDGQIRERVYREFLENGIEIPFPQMDVHLKYEPAEDNKVVVTQPRRKDKAVKAEPQADSKVE